MIRRWALVCLLTLAATPGPGAEAPTPPERPRETAPALPSNDDVTPPYEGKLERLAELMGKLAFLRDLCAAGDGGVWRAKMADLLTAEGTTPARRDRLAGAFNRGFEDYRVSYRTCTPAADLVIERSLAEGSAIARDLSARFGG